MYICIGTNRINVEQIQTYNFEQTAGVIIIFFTNETLMRFDGKEYDLDILILELDRVCNPKVLKGKLDEIKPIQIPIDKKCATCKYYENLMSDVPCNTCNPDGNNWEAEDEK